MVTLIMMMVVLVKRRERAGGEAEHSLSAWAHLACSPAPTSEWERKLANSKTEDCSFLFFSSFFLSLFPR